MRSIIASTYYATNHYLTRLKGKVAILMYHRVISEKELSGYYIQPGMYVKNDVFEMQMKFLKENFQILSFSELLNLWKDKKWDVTKRYCVITFDDGWLDNYIYAYPILKRYNIPATIFLPTSYIGTNQWFWPEKISYLLQYYFKNGIPLRQFTIPLFVKEGLGEITKDNKFQTLFSGKDEGVDSAIERCKGLPDEEINKLIASLCEALGQKIPLERLLLNWNEIEEMSKNGISFGSHSCSHKILTKLDPKDLRSEIADSLHVLREKRINSVPVFCYPNGDYSDSIIEQVKASGYQAAVSTLFGLEDGSPQNLFGLKRIGIHNDITSTISLFAYRISGIKLG
ncbi:MAG: polysaccharide deacetylase family protein [Thermodesulfovibrionales bacterium]